jgi:hypothetical protein
MLGCVEDFLVCTLASSLWAAPLPEQPTAKRTARHARIPRNTLLSFPLFTALLLKESPTNLREPHEDRSSGLLVSKFRYTLRNTTPSNARNLRKVSLLGKKAVSLIVYG